MNTGRGTDKISFWAANDQRAGFRNPCFSSELQYISQKMIEHNEGAQLRIAFELACIIL